MNILNHALEFIKAGISIIPLHHRSKVPALKSWEPFIDRLPTDTEYHSWFTTDWNNYGVIAGWNNLVVLDFDDLEMFDLWALWINSVVVGFADSCFKVLTSRGVHVYLRTASPSCNDKRIGIDVQAQRRFVVGPGCTHPSGALYQAVGAFQLIEVASVESVLPVALFPKVAPVASGCIGAYQGEPMTFTNNHTELHSDPFQEAMWTDDADLITKVKRRVNILSFFPDAHKTSTDGRWYAARCIFHDDHNPSAWIDAHRQLYGCNVCGMKPLDVINLYARTHNIDDRAAVRALAQECGVWQ